ncbi:MAG: hypothetical protein NTY89_03135 [Nostocales cyanobacterium LacPavin_0920_SED1_MAG_38_18]|nr:hypothetical protein [Nostocales cyanobacterium LacPavin_0920_SED1_MAG_38_18]
MKKIEIELDQETYDKIQQLTQTNHFGSSVPVMPNMSLFTPQPI